MSFIKKQSLRGMKRKWQIKFEYDRAIDAAYLRLSRGKVVASEEVECRPIVDLDENEEIVGIEILRFAQRFARQSRARKIAE